MLHSMCANFVTVFQLKIWYERYKIYKALPFEIFAPCAITISRSYLDFLLESDTHTINKESEKAICFQTVYLDNGLSSKKCFIESYQR